MISYNPYYYFGYNSILIIVRISYKKFFIFVVVIKKIIYKLILNSLQLNFSFSKIDLDQNKSILKRSIIF